MSSPSITAAGDLRRLVGRDLRRELRVLDGLIVNTALPVMIMLMFVYVFGGAITTGSSGLDYIDFVVPAVLLMSGGYGAALTAVTIAEDMTGGMIDRFRTLPISGWVVPAGHVVASVIRNVASSAIALAAALLLGFRPDATLTDWALVLALVTGYVLAMSALAAVWGLLVRSSQAAGAFSFVVLFLPYVSDGIVPAQTMPGLLRDFAYNQPLTPIIETMRSLLLGLPMGSSAAVATAWLAGAVVVCVPVAAVLFRRRTASR
ncbi:ABC transporter, permease protein [[Actinomadura] parvosata subsp. kistnae]|uniref:Transport permease protein n=1 Tax=[Actinomadura] parvosata subsp. kistnae TaxID=1909395 RepID=A0A1V0A4D8_9ACTN|nr:ABC transporter permease [Nonomuraea sp. ATCC 55076]AQZ65012.1 multidrug ABC transporter permease [Nonomuraea sp. ATCC 55076]SPL96261.1 ABC transporter, permease protein [Actinomadura parvosata subsp. kistnae]